TFGRQPLKIVMALIKNTSRFLSSLMKASAPFFKIFGRASYTSAGIWGIDFKTSSGTLSVVVFAGIVGFAVFAILRYLQKSDAFFSYTPFTVEVTSFSYRSNDIRIRDLVKSAASPQRLQ